MNVTNFTKIILNMNVTLNFSFIKAATLKRSKYIHTYIHIYCYQKIKNNKNHQKVVLLNVTVASYKISFQLHSFYWTT